MLIQLSIINSVQVELECTTKGELLSTLEKWANDCQPDTNFCASLNSSSYKSSQESMFVIREAEDLFRREIIYWGQIDYENNITLSWRRSLSYRNQFIDLQNKSMDWFLYDKDLRHERVKGYFLVNN